MVINDMIRGACHFFFFFSFFFGLSLADLGFVPLSVLSPASVLEVRRLAEGTVLSDLSEAKLTADEDRESGLNGGSDPFSSRIRLKKILYGTDIMNNLSYFILIWQHSVLNNLLVVDESVYIQSPNEHSQLLVWYVDPRTLKPNI